MTKKISANDGHFIANGRKYVIEYDLTVARYRTYEELAHLIAFGVDVERLVKSQQEIMAALSGNDIMGGIRTAHEIAFNNVNALATFNAEKENAIFLFATLFINQEDEDLTTWSESKAREKIDDWKKEGISAASFFLLAAKQIKGYNQLLQSLLQDDAINDETMESYVRLADATIPKQTNSEDSSSS